MRTRPGRPGTGDRAGASPGGQEECAEQRADAEQGIGEKGERHVKLEPEGLQDRRQGHGKGWERKRQKGKQGRQETGPPRKDGELRRTGSGRMAPTSGPGNGEKGERIVGADAAGAAPGQCPARQGRRAQLPGRHRRTAVYAPRTGRGRWNQGASIPPCHLVVTWRHGGTIERPHNSNLGEISGQENISAGHAGLTSLFLLSCTAMTFRFPPGFQTRP